jgi:hypothetical protein
MSGFFETSNREGTSRENSERVVGGSTIAAGAKKKMSSLE